MYVFNHEVCQVELENKKLGEDTSSKAAGPVGSTFGVDSIHEKSWTPAESNSQALVRGNELSSDSTDS
jgi:hypothetical protein